MVLRGSSRFSEVFPGGGDPIRERPKRDDDN